MAEATISIKHGVKVVSGVAFPRAGGAAALLAAVERATGVPAARAKLMHKLWKGARPCDAEVALLPDGATVGVMGAAELAVQSSAAPTVFVEDLPAAQLQLLGQVLPAGLVNEQNTCYMNSVLEVVRAVPELRKALTDSRSAARRGGGAGAGAGAAYGSARNPADAALSSSLADLLARLESSSTAVEPSDFLDKLRAKNPMFAERGAHGHFKQHDSEEFLSMLMTTLATQLTTPLAAERLLGISGSDIAPNVLDTLFGLEADVEMTCRESPDEPIVRMKEGHRKLMALIDGGPGRLVQVNHINEGLLLGLTGSREKQSVVLGRNAAWGTTTRIARLPKYLFVQLGRFFWKALNNAPGDGPAGVPCKILKPVAFPADKLDVLDLCNAPIKAALTEARKLADAAKDAKLAASAAAVASTKPTATSATVDDSEDAEMQAALRMSMGEGTSSSNAAAASTSSAAAAAASSSSSSSASLPLESLGSQLPQGFLGYYELFGVVSHKGRDSRSGHYISWVRKSGADWLIFDDDSVVATDTKTVVDKLKGGGDDFMAYLLFFRAKSGE